MVENAKNPQWQLILDMDRLGEMIERVMNARDNETGLFKNGYTEPERKVYTVAREFQRYSTIKLWSPNLPLHTFFQYVTVLFQDDTTRQLLRLADKNIFEEYFWLFDPKTVATETEEKVKDAATNLVRPGTNKAAIDYWHQNSKVICDKYGGDLVNFFKEYDFDAVRIVEALETQSRDGLSNTFKRFGPKISRLFVLWADEYTLAGRKLNRMSEIGIQVDFQTARLAIQVGAIRLAGPTHVSRVTTVLMKAYTDYCMRHPGLSPNKLSQSLWFTGHAGCNKHLHHECPLEDICTMLISRIPYDRAGMFYPTDHGRYKSRQQVLTNIKRAKQNVYQRENGQTTLPLEIPITDLEEMISTLPYGGGSKGRLGIKPSY